jgi:TRAP-type C4-dicarboxylate transport system permease small subunit
MNTTKLVAIALIVLGALGLAYGGFTYTKDTHTAEIGALQLQVEEKEHVYVPVWAGLGAVLVGVALLVLPKRS